MGSVRFGVRGPFKCYVTQWSGCVSAFPEKSITKLYSPTFLALRGGGCKISRKKAF